LLLGDPAIRICKANDKFGITQAESAKRVGSTHPHRIDLIKNHSHKLTLNALVAIAAQLSYVVNPSLKQVA